MRKWYGILLLALVSAVCCGPARADSEVCDYELKTGSFSKLRVVNNVNVVYTASLDSAGLAVFRAPKEMADFFIVSNNNGTLKVETLPQMKVMRGLPTLYVYSEFLSDAQNDSDSTLYIRSVKPCPRFKAELIGNGRLIVDNLRATDVECFLNTGNGTISVNGECSNAKFKMVGTGLIQADELMSENVKCTILGGGTIGCWPRFGLNVKGIGSTKIYYKGHPQVSKRGGGKLLRLEDEDDESADTLRE